MTDDAVMSDELAGPALMQPPLSHRIPKKPKEGLPPGEDVERQEQAPGSGLPSDVSPRVEDAEQAAQAALAEPPPVIPGMDEDDWARLSENERSKLRPILDNIQRGVSQKLQNEAENAKKAAAWEAAISIPEVSQALRKSLGYEAETTVAPTQQAAASQDLMNDMGELDGAKLQATIHQSVQSILREVVEPLKREIETLRGHVGQSVVDSQFLNLEKAHPGISKHREEILDLVGKGEAATILSAYDQIMGRLVRQGKYRPGAPQVTPEQRRADTIASETAGPTPEHVFSARSHGMYEHLKAALREHGLEISS